MAVIVLRSYGQRSTLPSSVRYHELQPVFHTVGPSAAATSSLNFVVASSVTSTVSISPSRNRCNHCAIYRAVSSAEYCSEIDPVERNAKRLLLQEAEIGGQTSERRERTRRVRHDHGADAIEFGEACRMHRAAAAKRKQCTVAAVDAALDRHAT